MEKLNLPEYSFKIRETDGYKEIFDNIRKKYLKLNPEEWVRQNFISYLLNEKSYPNGLLLIEKEIKLHGLKRRPDLVVYSKEAKPIVIVEFKAPSVKIDEEVFFQAAMYNKKLQVPYLILSNGIQHYCAHINTETGIVKYLPQIPDFTDL